MNIRSVGWSLAIAIAACSGPPPSPSVDVALYVRNLDEAEAILTLDPQTDPPTILGIGAVGDPAAPSIGAACHSIPVGSTVWLMDLLGTRAGGQRVERLFTALPADDGVARWVEVGPDRAATTGLGVPPWWSGDVQEC